MAAEAIEREGRPTPSAEATQATNKEKESGTQPIRLRHFVDILPTERAAINARRAEVKKRRDQEKTKKPGTDAKSAPQAGGGDAATQKAKDKDDRIHLLKAGKSSSDLLHGYAPAQRGAEAPARRDPRTLRDPDHAPQPPDPTSLQPRRPKPEPCDTVGLALSGGGIRSASFCLGVLQALNQHRVIDSVDYLSTVSGGGYIGTCMTASMTRNGGTFPFDGGNDIADNPNVAHIRNYSNYLLPRGRSGWRNFSEAAAVILRGLFANIVIVTAVLLVLALLTVFAFPKRGDLLSGSFLPRLVDATAGLVGWNWNLSQQLGSIPFSLTLWLIGIVIALLLYWVLLRSLSSLLLPTSHRLLKILGGLVILYVILFAGPLLVQLLVNLCLGKPTTGLLPLLSDAFSNTSNTLPWFVPWVFLAGAGLFQLFHWGHEYYGATDTRNPLLLVARVLLIAIVVVALLDLQPILIELLIWLHGKPDEAPTKAYWLAVAPIVGAIAVALLSSQVGHFLKSTQFSTNIPTMILRVLYSVIVIVAALVAPVTILCVYLYFSAWGIADSAGVPNPFQPAGVVTIYLYALLALAVPVFVFRPNAYSLHQIYRDRLSYAFLFDAGRYDWDRFKLSHIDTRKAPYLIVNTAMNVQGSEEANLRGRDADFFAFTRDFIGSDLTLYAPTRERLIAHTRDMEAVDPSLDLAAAMATSGAAVSANMGSATLRLMSPTLALLNIRLGYWIRNPRSLAKRGWSQIVPGWIDHFFTMKFYLLIEMLNLLNEKSRNIYLTDGGHIENLGIYELLKRGCQLIIAVDAECDPDISCPSLLKLERYARIDLGVRIELPWEKIAKRTEAVNRQLDGGQDPDPHKGPHCAVGRILYNDDTQGLLLYIKSSLTGDEKDYVTGYKKRYPHFPHETTGDQFFSEEQLEVYRALGFHAAIGFLSGTDDFAWSKDTWPDQISAREAVTTLIRTFAPA